MKNYIYKHKVLPTLYLCFVDDVLVRASSKPLLNNYEIIDEKPEIAYIFDAYLEGKIKGFNVDYSLVQGTEFQKNVLTQLLKVPYGNTTTYGELAKMANTKAIRAVGTALAKNPLPLIFPCHRVIRSDGGIGDFGWGADVKQYLLDLEQVNKDI